MIGLLDTCTMKRTLFTLAILCLACAASAQEYPKLKELSEKEMAETLVPAEKKGRWGYANEKGNFRIKAVFDAAEEFKSTKVNDAVPVSCARIMSAGKYGYISSTGLYLLEPEFDSITDFDRGVAIFTKNGTAGLVNALGKVLVDGTEEILPFDGRGLAWFRRDGRWGAYDLQGNVVFENGYDGVPEEHYGALSIVRTDGRAGFISLDRKRVLMKPCADSVWLEPNDSDLLLFRKDGRCGCWHVDGKELLRPDYDRISVTEDGRILVQMLDRYGLWSKSGEMLLASCMMTNQIEEKHAFYQIFEEKGGRRNIKVYYKDRLMEPAEFDDMTFKEMSPARYMERDAEYERFPYWMKRHLKDVMSPVALKSQWRFDNAFHQARPVVRTARPEEGICPDGESHVTVGKDMRLLDSKGFSVPANKALSKLAVLVDGVAVPVGGWLTPLLKSVTSAKVAAYDKAMGTSLASEWKTVTARVRNKGFAPDGDVVIVVDIMAGDVLAQRVVAKSTTSGTLRFSIRKDGILNNRTDYVWPDESRCFVADGMIFFSYLLGEGRALRTSFHTLTGKVMTDLDDFYAELMLAQMPVLKLFGRDSDYFCTCRIDMAARSFSKSGVGMESSKTFIRMSESHICFYDRDTRLLKATLETGSEHMPVAALRYAGATWDGRRIIGVSANHWDNAAEAVWTYVPRVGSGTFAENINGYMLTVYPADAEGIAVYSLSPDIWSNEGVMYGFIGYDTDFFTQALFEDAKPFADGKAQVKMAGVWKTLAKEDFGIYLDDPSEAHTSDNYCLGRVIFDAARIEKARTMNNPDVKDMTTEEGYRLMTSKGGELIGFQNVHTGKYGFVDAQGAMVVAPVFDAYHSCDFSMDGMVAVRRSASEDPDDGWGFIDMAGNIVIPCSYYRFWTPDVKSFFSEGENGICPMCRIMTGGLKRMGCLNRKGEVVTPFEYDSISWPTDGIMTARLGDMTMKINQEGVML